MGGKFANYDNREVPDTMEVLWHYPGDTLVTFSQYNATGARRRRQPCEIEFRGTKGTLYFNSNGYEVVPEMHHAQRVRGPHADRIARWRRAGAPARSRRSSRRRWPGKIRTPTTPATSSTA